MNILLPQYKPGFYLLVEEQFLLKEYPKTPGKCILGGNMQYGFGEGFLVAAYL